MTADEITKFIQKENPKFNKSIAKAYIEIGEKYNIRGDVAICQAILETGWFKYGGGTAVTPDQHNYCGLGVTSKGVKGNSFNTIEEGVTAQIQHLYAYATNKNVPKGEKIIDPRFKYVSKGSANDSWEGLSMKWAMNEDYGKNILSLYEKLKTTKATKEPNAKYEISDPLDIDEARKLLDKVGDKVISVSSTSINGKIVYTISYKK